MVMYQSHLLNIIIALIIENKNKEIKIKFCIMDVWKGCSLPFPQARKHESCCDINGKDIAP